MITLPGIIFVTRTVLSVIRKKDARSKYSFVFCLFFFLFCRIENTIGMILPSSIFRTLGHASDAVIMTSLGQCRAHSVEETSKFIHKEQWISTQVLLGHANYANQLLATLITAMILAQGTEYSKKKPNSQPEMNTNYPANSQLIPGVLSKKANNHWNLIGLFIQSSKQLYIQTTYTQTFLSVTSAVVIAACYSECLKRFWRNRHPIKLGPISRFSTLVPLRHTSSPSVANVLTCGRITARAL